MRQCQYVWMQATGMSRCQRIIKMRTGRTGDIWRGKNFKIRAIVNVIVQKICLQVIYESHAVQESIRGYYYLDVHPQGQT